MIPPVSAAKEDSPAHTADYCLARAVQNERLAAQEIDPKNKAILQDIAIR